MYNLKHWPLIIGLVTAFLAASPVMGSSVSEPGLFTQDYVEPGDVVQVVITGDPMDSILVSLQDAQEETVSRAEGFRWSSPKGSTIAVALLGVPPTTSPGRYQLVVHGDQDQAEVRLEKFLMVTEYPYPEQTIKLSDKMDALYKDNSKRKKTEAQVLWSILTTFNPNAIHSAGSLSYPLEEVITTAGFGDHRRYQMPDGSESFSVHFGQDFRGKRGTPVTASGRGRVVLAVERLLTGNTVILEHLPGVYTLYYHLDSIAVGHEEIVDRGELIGTVGQTGFATGNHLHWELRVGTVPVDPNRFLDKPLLDTGVLISKM